MCMVFPCSYEMINSIHVIFQLDYKIELYNVSVYAQSWRDDFSKTTPENKIIKIDNSDCSLGLRLIIYRLMHGDGEQVESKVMHAHNKKNIYMNDIDP